MMDAHTQEARDLAFQLAKTRPQRGWEFVEGFAD